MRVAIVTISDSYFPGERRDTSGDAIEAWCVRRGDVVVSREVIKDETSAIARRLVALCDSGDADIVLTTGGTGLTARDVTPEATRAVIEREAPGIAELMRVSHYDRVPRAALSRGVAGIRGKTLVINLPGSTSAVQDGLATLLSIIDHAVDLVTGKVTRHVTPPFSQDSI